MKVYVKNVHGLDLQSDVTDRELIVILQAYDRGLVKGAKIAVVLDGRLRFLDVEAIDRERTLPGVVFSGYTVPPPPRSGILPKDTEPHAADAATR